MSEQEGLHLTKKGAKLLQKYHKEFLKAYKKGYSQAEANDIALDKVNSDPVDLAIHIVLSVEPGITEELLLDRVRRMFPADE